MRIKPKDFEEIYALKGEEILILVEAQNEEESEKESIDEQIIMATVQDVVITSSKICLRFKPVCIQSDYVLQVANNIEIEVCGDGIVSTDATVVNDKNKTDEILSIDFKAIALRKKDYKQIKYPNVYEINKSTN